jgi:acyl-CoA reductase-like NAD-dependent aldehyde dehydrogenase
MDKLLICHSPIDGRLIAERPYVDPDELPLMLARSRMVQHQWASQPLAQRRELIGRFVDAVLRHRAEIADELTLQMGRPRRYTEKEVEGFAERARYMIDIAQDALKDIKPATVPGVIRFMRREPLGLVLIVAPWNYPLLTTVNSLVPALLAGNSVLLKPSAQTPLVGERLQACAKAILPDGLLQTLHLRHADTLRLLEQETIDGVCFTGSVGAGVAVETACAGRFLHLGLELGGCDPAYVRSDADLKQAVDSIIDGALFNSGQSCCGIQRIYVHKSRYDEFLSLAKDILKTQVLGDPRLPATTLGPLVRACAADEARAAAFRALARGARDLLDPLSFPLEAEGSAYMAPRLLADCNESMDLMREEFFAPIAGIQSVDDDAHALRLMNDSDYGLTAAIYTRDPDAAMALGQKLQTGTVFMNRCDQLDPALAWTGVKQTGRGVSLSRLGFDQLTRIKSFHFKTE